MIFRYCFGVFQAQILRKYPRRPCGSFWSGLELRRPTIDRFRLLFSIFLLKKCVFFIVFPVFFNEFLCFSPQRRQPRQRLRPRLLRLNDNLVASTTTASTQRRLGGYDHGNGYDHDCCGSTAARWLRPRQRLRPRLIRINGGFVATTTATATTTAAATQRRLGG